MVFYITNTFPLSVTRHSEKRPNSGYGFRLENLLTMLIVLHTVTAQRPVAEL